MLKSMDSLEKEKEKVGWLNDYLVNSLKDAPIEYNLMGQIERYIDSLRIIRYGETKNTQKRFFDVAPTDRVAIFNSGIVGQNIYSIYVSKKIATITGWFDKDYEFYQEQGLNVQSFNEIPNTEFDKIIVANLDEKSIQSALKILQSLGVDSKKIITLL